MYTTDPGSAVVIGLHSMDVKPWGKLESQGLTSCSAVAALVGPTSEQQLVTTPVTEVLPMADMRKRRPKEQWWMPVGQVIRLLASYD